MNLPIDIATTHPFTFRWRQVIDTAVGQRVVEHVGSLPMTCEAAVANLIGIANQQALEIEKLKEPPHVETPPTMTSVPRGAVLTPPKRGK